MLVVILIYDQLMFRPLVAWADRFRIDSEPSEEVAAILGADRLSPLPAAGPDDRAVRADDALVLLLASAAASACGPRVRDVDSRVADIVWYALLALLGACWRVGASMTSPMPV